MCKDLRAFQINIKRKVWTMYFCISLFILASDGLKLSYTRNMSRVFYLLLPWIYRNYVYILKIAMHSLKLQQKLGLQFQERQNVQEICLTVLLYPTNFFTKEIVRLKAHSISDQEQKIRNQDSLSVTIICRMALPINRIWF